MGIIESNLKKYHFIEEFLGSIIKQRLAIPCYTHGMLTGNLLDEQSDADLKRLESALRLGKLYCRDFKQIFRGRRLPQQSEIADGQIIDILAEVKAFEFLHNQGFSDIASVERQSVSKTVDFTAKRNDRNHAIEVTRLGLAQSEKKQPVYYYKASTIDYTTKCEDASGYEVSMMTEGLNNERIRKEICDAIQRKYSQIKEYCEREAGTWRGVLIVSSGRDYFAMGKYENKAYDQTPEKDFLEALEEVWERFKEKQKDEFLHRIVIIRGKDLRKAVICPSFKVEE